MPVLSTTMKKGGDIHEGEPILEGLFVRIQRIRRNGKLYTAESWSTNGVFEDAERFLERNEKRDRSTRSSKVLSSKETTMPTEQDSDHSPQNTSWKAIHLLNKFYDDIEVDVSLSSSSAAGEFDDAERFLEGNEKRVRSTRAPKDSWEETSMPTKQDCGHSRQNTSWKAIQILLNKFYDDIEVDVSLSSSGAAGVFDDAASMPTKQDGDHSRQNTSWKAIQTLLNKFYDDIEVDDSPSSIGAASASPASICGKRKYDAANSLQRRKKVVEVFLRGIEKLLNPGYASFLRESLMALNISTLNMLTNTFRYEYNVYLSGRTNVGETVSKTALKRVLKNTFESSAPYDTGVSKLHRAWQMTTDRSNRKGQGCRQVHSAKWWQSGNDNAAQGNSSDSCTAMTICSLVADY